MVAYERQKFEFAINCQNFNLQLKRHDNKIQLTSQI